MTAIYNISLKQKLGINPSLPKFEGRFVLMSLHDHSNKKSKQVISKTHRKTPILGSL